MVVVIQIPAVLSLSSTITKAESIASNSQAQQWETNRVYEGNMKSSPL